MEEMTLTHTGSRGMQYHIMIDRSTGVFALRRRVDFKPMSWTPTVQPGITRTYVIAFLFAFINQGAFAQFGEQRVFSTQAQEANRLCAADFDNDGDEDIASASPGDNKVAWYENVDGFGAFGSQSIVSQAAQRVNSIHCTDLDRDGNIDILSASRDDNAISWHRNTGLGIFAVRTTITTNAFVAMSVYSIDLDNDGDEDVLSASRDDNKIAWYEHLDGNGAFGPQQIISSTAMRAFDVYAADLDGDGDMDVLSASEFDDKIAWYENTNGQGAFSAERIITLSADAAHDVHAADIDGDGDFDVLAASSFSNSITWYENTNGSGAFSEPRLISNQTAFAHYVQTADIDLDGDLDVLSASINDSKIAWYPNIDGQGTFGTQRIISTSGVGATSVIAVNIDGDQDLDIVATSMFDNKVAWYESFAGKGRVRFGFSSAIASGDNTLWAHQVIAADIDGDRDLDVLSASFLDDKIAWYANNSGRFGAQQIISGAADGARDVQVADLDNDGDLDVLSASGNDNGIKWYQNIDGNGRFGGLQVISEEAENPYAVSPADIDGDGDIDVVTASFDDDTIAWFSNLDGEGFFGPLIAISTAAKGATDVVTADIDGDGDIDVVSASSFDDKIAWYRNLDGAGDFGGQVIIDEDADLAISVHVADIDSDGDLDILSASSGNNTIAWYDNLDGLGTFSRPNIITLEAHRAFSVYTADLDTDGDLDVLSASREDNVIAWYENLDRGLFGERTVISASAQGARSVYAADLDNDGDPDVLSASQDDDRVSWYENLSLIGTVLDNETPETWETNFDASVFPNPASHTATLAFSLDRPQHVVIDVYDMQGRRVAQMHNGYLSANNEHRLAFHRNALPSGVYMVRIQGEQVALTRKVVIL